MGFIRRNFKRLFNYSVFFLVLAVLPGLPPNTTFEFESYEVPPSLPLEGVLAPNNLLDGTERLFENEILGPENLVYHNGAIYTGVHGGELIKIVGQRFEHVAKFGKACAGVVEEELCGRILGLALDTVEKNSLIVVDTYYGIYHYNLDTRKEKLLVSPETVLDGDKPRRSRMMNSVAVAKNGDIYWTDSSSDFPIVNGMYIMLSNPHGRIFHYDRKNNINRVLADRINFANGIALSPDEDFLVVSETGSGRLLKYTLRGEKKGKLETFIEGLPGLPDNLTPDRHGLWVPLVVSRDENHPMLTMVLARTPWLRKFLQRLIHGIEAPFVLIEKYYPNPYTAKVKHAIGNLNVPLLFPARNTVLRVNWNGEIVKAYHGFDQSVTAISHVEQVGEYLYFGSPYVGYLGRKHLPGDLPQTIPAPKPAATPTKPVTTQKPTTTTQKPTTTTPKPTTTTPKPTTQKQTTTTTTTTPKPTTQKQTTTTPKPTTTTTPKPTPAPKPATPKTQKQEKPTVPPPPPPLFEDDDAEEIEVEDPYEIIEEAPRPAKNTKPAPIIEEREDVAPPPPPKLKVIKRGGEQGEL